MRNDHETLWYLINKLTEIADTYTIFKNNESERDTNTVLGKWAIKYNIIFFLFFGGAVALAIWAIYMFQSSVLFGILIVIGALGFAITSIVFVILAFACDISQMKLNKKPIGLVSLLTTLFIIIGGIAAIIITALIGF